MLRFYWDCDVCWDCTGIVMYVGIVLGLWCMLRVYWDCDVC